MSYRLHRKSRPQADVEIYGGPLKQGKFDGGMNIDSPASEIASNEVAYAENVIFREYGIEARPGSVRYSTDDFTPLTSANVLGYVYSPTTYTGAYSGYRNTINYNGVIRSYKDNPGGTGSQYINAGAFAGVGITGDWSAGTGDTTIIPYRRGYLTFTSSKISYSEVYGAFQVNSPNPVHGFKDDVGNASNFKYRYLFTLSRIITYGQDPSSLSISDDRLAAGAEVVHESGTNDRRYYNSGTSSSVARDHDYGEVYKASAITTGSPYTVLATNLTSAFGSAASYTDDSAAAHFTHVSIYRTLDYGTTGVDPVSGQGNNSALYVWVGDVKRSDAGSNFSDTISDETLRNRLSSGSFLLKTQGFVPMPSGSCAEVAGGWMFVADRTNATPETRLSYCAIAASPENIGYYFPDVQNYRFNDGIRALKANQDILSIFCNSSSHICNMTAVNNDLSKVQYVPFLTYFHTVDYTIGIKDWGTLDSVDQNTMIAVCSDASVRLWDTTRWGDDLSYGKVKTEIEQIVPASTTTYARGSVGRYFKGAYYLWYSKGVSDTATTRALRYGFGKQAGYGWGYYTGWVYPMFKTGACVITDNNGVQRLIVMSAALGARFFWVETFNAYTGALDATDAVTLGTHQLVRRDTDLAPYNQAGTEISSVIKFRELLGAEEADVLVHDETFFRWRPRVESVGYRSGMSVTFYGYENGSAVPTSTYTSAPKTGSLKFQDEVSDRRVQLGVAANVGGWRLVGVDSHFRSLDRTNYATSGDVSSSESTTSYPQYQANVAANIKTWVTRRGMYLDRATATNLTATGAITAVTGPDGKAGSALRFPLGAYLSKPALGYIMGDDFTVSFWIKDAAGQDNELLRLEANQNFVVYLSVGSDSALYFGPTGALIGPMSDGGWDLITIVRRQYVFYVYKNATFITSIAESNEYGGGLFQFGHRTTFNGTDPIELFDLRITKTAWTAEAITYYYNDVVNNNGNYTLPMV